MQLLGALFRTQLGADRWPNGPAARHRSAAMPRYHFNIVDGVSQPDPEGTDLVDLAEVRRQALRLSGEVLRELSSVLWEHPEWSLTVTDDAGATVLALKFVAEQAS